MGIRVYELAKELGFSSKGLVQKLNELHVSVKGHMSSLDEDTAELVRHELAGEAKKAAPVKAPKTAKPPEKIVEMKVVTGKLPLSVKDISVKLQLSANDLIKKLMNLGIMASINYSLDEEMVNKISSLLGFRFEKELSDEEVLLVKHRREDAKNLMPRPPVVTLMGHVDHGKTSLLDVIRSSNITQKESGGITQHIGAYEVALPKGRITFFDTPGHEAFTAMRARGANITDIVIIVVAADDGIMPQTVEAINHAKAANVPIVVAINKIDLPGANIDNVRRQLAEIDLNCEEWGGKTITVPVSAKKGTGVERLLEMLVLEAELLELRANPTALARGAIIESKISKGSGPTATILVQNGTLRIGDVFVCGVTFGKVRSMVNDLGQRLNAAGPSVPVEISGLAQVPQVGDVLYVVEDERKAKELSGQKNEALRKAKLIPAQRVSLEQLFLQAQEGQLKELNLIIKADVHGSLEALISSLKELGTKDIAVKIIHAQVGSINESDVMLAIASDAVILGFHVTIDAQAKDTAEKKNVDVRMYRIIYEAINDVRLSMEGLLAPTIRETFIGRAKVLQPFKVSNVGTIAGSVVVKGKFVRTAEKVRLFRAEQCLFEGKLASLKRHKDDVKEVSEGMECGIGLDKFMSIEPDDIIECYHIEKIARKL
ncbi:MAG: translation initiation factor IF-2 [Candidatus Omnitrophica bacterium]|nr:translation initiation factor IF-2 [Candidatus Omnitrophota bacterium]MBU4478374.1 translation initiation factor IF-2 [Candidatus Omnitrophota bacterium]MCG2703959.1 translation initiation factor IF-2 [Candidatus Omnitrophota bacterium]